MGVRFGFLAGLAAVVATLVTEAVAIAVIGDSIGKRRRAELVSEGPSSSRGSLSVRDGAFQRDGEAERAAVEAGSIALFSMDSFSYLDREAGYKVVRAFYESLKSAFAGQVELDVQPSAASVRAGPDGMNFALIAFHSPDKHRAGFALDSECFSFSADALKAIDLWSLAPAKGGGGFSASLYFIDRETLEGSFDEKWALVGPRLVSFDFDVDYSQEAAVAIAIAIERIGAITGAKVVVHEGVDV